MDQIKTFEDALQYLDIDPVKWRRRMKWLALWLFVKALFTSKPYRKGLSMEKIIALHKLTLISKAMNNDLWSPTWPTNNLPMFTSQESAEYAGRQFAHMYEEVLGLKPKRSIWPKLIFVAIFVITLLIINYLIWKN